MGGPAVRPSALGGRSPWVLEGAERVFLNRFLNGSLCVTGLPLVLFCKMI